MFVQTIKMTNSRGSLNQNTRNNNKIDNPTIKIERNIAKDKVSFGMFDPFTFFLTQVAGKLFKYGMDESNIEKAEKLIREGSLAEGVAIATKLNTNYKDTLLNSLSGNLDSLTNTVACKLNCLSDNNENIRNLKKGFVSSVFLRQTKTHVDNFIETYNTDVIPKEVKTLFKCLGNNIYGEFKKNLLSEAVLERDIIIDNAEDLLKGVGDKNFRNKILSAIEKERKRHQEAVEREDYRMDNYHPGCSG